MHAMVMNALHAPLAWTELPDRLPGAGQIRVKVAACGVCRTDLHVVDGELPHPQLAFGTSGHRGCSLDGAFNEWHVLAITQALCEHRRAHGIGGPLFLGMDTHALSAPASISAIEVLAANGVDVMLAFHDEPTPTPAVSHAIVAYNLGRSLAHPAGLADGIVITPSHNPPRDGGFKYNPPHGGPAGQGVTHWVEACANAHLRSGLKGVKRMPLASALRASTTHRHDYLHSYVADLGNVVDMGEIRDARVRLGVDPMGGAGVHYWPAIAERYSLDLHVVNEVLDPTFAFIPPDWDGQIRMDPASPLAMKRLIALKDHFDVAFACDTDHDRHGIVTPSCGLLAPNHYLSVATDHLFRNRPAWGARAAIGKSVVSTQLIDRVASRLGRALYETPVGFKWFSEGLLNGSLGFAGEESAGASFLRRDGTAWTTDKDGIAAALLSAEITAVQGMDPGRLYADLALQLGNPLSQLFEAAATPAQKQRLAEVSAQDLGFRVLAGEAVLSALTHAPGNGAPIGGIKVSTEHGWFAARPSGTEDLCKIYAESFKGSAHLQAILLEAQNTVSRLING
jgi:phosphoglucomutase